MYSVEFLADNPDHKHHQEIVLSFVRLKGRPSRPIDETVIPRQPEDFARVRRKLPDDFFDPFNQLLRVVNMPPIRVEPDSGIIAEWNHKDFMPKLRNEVTDSLDNRRIPRLVPALVSAFYNLERQRAPSDEEWPTLSAIAVPGSRTFERAAEAFRAYLFAQGRPFILLAGRAPYYDPSNAGYDLTEAEANEAYLRMLSIPKERIYIEDRSQDTKENAEFLPAVLKEIGSELEIKNYKILLVTSPFHLARYRLNTEMMLEESGVQSEIFAIGSKASRYWAETYFIEDSKSGYTRESTMGVVFNEYLKIAFDLCADKRPMAIKAEAPRL